MGNTQSSVPDTSPKAVRGPQAHFATDPVTGTTGDDNFENLAKPEAPDSTEWPSTAPLPLYSGRDEYHVEDPRAHEEPGLHSRRRRASAEDHIKPAPPSSPPYGLVAEPSPVLNGVNGTKSKRGKKAKRKRERSSNSLFTQSDEAQKNIETHQLSPELPQLPEHKIIEDDSQSLRSKKRRRRNAAPEPQHDSAESLQVQSPTAQIELESEGTTLEMEDQRPANRRKRRRDSVNDKRTEVQADTIDADREWHAAGSTEPAILEEPSLPADGYESGLNGQLDPAQMEIDDPLLEEIPSSKEVASQEVDRILRLLKNATNGELEQDDDGVADAISQQNGVKGGPSEDNANEGEAVVNGTPRIDFGFESLGSERASDSDQDLPPYEREVPDELPSGEDDVGIVTNGNYEDVDERMEQDEQDGENDDGSQIVGDLAESSKARRNASLEVGQGQALESGDEAPREDANYYTGQDESNPQADLDENVSDADLAATLEKITTPLSKSAERAIALKSSAKQRSKPSFFDLMNGASAATTRKTSARASTSSKRKAAIRKSPPFETPTRQNIAAAFAQLPASEAVATAKKPKANPAKEVPENPSHHQNRVAFSQLPRDEAVATVKRRRGRPPKNIPGSDAYALTSSPMKQKMSSQMLAGQNGDAPASSGAQPSSSKQTAPSKAGLASGPFTQAELDAIAEAIESFRDSCGMSQFELNAMVQEPPRSSGSNLHKDLWQRVTASCPNRPRQKVINRTRRIYHNFVGRGTWTPEQDEELQSMVAKHGTKWAVIGGLINRHPEDIRDRWINYLKGGENRKADFWSPEEEAQLVELAVEMLKEIQKSRGEDISVISPTSEADIPWRYVSDKMDSTRNPRQCRMKWKQLREANKVAKQEDDADFSFTQPEDDVSSRLDQARSNLRKMEFEDKLQLIKAIRKTDVKKDTEIPWSTLVTKKYRRQWSEATLKLLWTRLRQTLPGHQTKSTRRVAEKLLREYEAHKEFNNILDMDFDDEEEGQLIGSTPARRKGYRTPRKFVRPVSSANIVDESGSKAVAEAEDVVEDEPEAPTSAQKPVESSGDEEEIPASPTSNEVVPRRQQVDEMGIDDDEDGVDANGTAATDRSGSVDLGTTNEEDAMSLSKVGASSPTPQSKAPKSATAGMRREKRAESDGSSVNAESFKLKRKRPGLLYKSPADEKTKRDKKRKKKRKSKLTISQDEIEDDSEAEKRRRQAEESDADNDMEDIPARLPVQSTEEDF